MAPSLAQLLSLLPPLLLLSPARALTLRSDASSSLPTLKHELRGASACRCFPGDPCWPTPAQWKAFNSTLGGKLIVTVQLLHPVITIASRLTMSRSVMPYRTYGSTRRHILTHPVRSWLNTSPTIAVIHSYLIVLLVPLETTSASQ